MYFVSFATVNWIDVFTRQQYFDVLVESVNYCRTNKFMELYAYCFMPNHACPERNRRIHLNFKSSNEQPMELLRDFKKFTAKKILEAITNNPQESRKEWLLWKLVLSEVERFEKAGKSNSNITKYQFWQHHNKPIELWSENVVKQKIDYIHNNPVVSGFVTNPIDWKYSSARNFAEDHTVLKIDAIGFLGITNN